MPNKNNHGKKSSVLVHAGDLFDTVKPRTRAYTTVLEALDRLHATGARHHLVLNRSRTPHRSGMGRTTRLFGKGRE
jgi:DNA repair exonuclease SbcCD nuclease subunit